MALLLPLLCGCTAAPGDTAPSDTSKPTETLPSTTQSTQDTTPTTAPTVPKPTKPSVLDFLRIAAQPVGKCMYVWGGGWNEADTGAGIEAIHLGISARWEEFAAAQGSDYDYKTTRYQIHDGLDCSGYVGWAVYNAVETENGREGYVCSSTQMAEKLAVRGLGQCLTPEESGIFQPGDIVSIQGHVWIAVSVCDDGSVLLLHASPPGVMFSGTKLPDGSESQATVLANKIMAEYYPNWYVRFPDSARSHTYLENCTVFRWTALENPENLPALTAEEVVNLILHKK